MTKTPEQWLEHAAPEKKGGTLKLFLGYAPGVGKTFNMLSEAIRSGFIQMRIAWSGTPMICAWPAPFTRLIASST